MSRRSGYSLPPPTFDMRRSRYDDEELLASLGSVPMFSQPGLDRGGSSMGYPGGGLPDEPSRPRTIGPPRQYLSSGDGYSGRARDSYALSSSGESDMSIGARRRGPHYTSAPSYRVPSPDFGGGQARSAGGPAPSLAFARQPNDISTRMRGLSVTTPLSPPRQSHDIYGTSPGPGMYRSPPTASPFGLPTPSPSPAPTRHTRGFDLSGSIMPASAPSALSPLRSPSPAPMYGSSYRRADPFSPSYPSSSQRGTNAHSPAHASPLQCPSSTLPSSAPAPRAVMQHPTTTGMPPLPVPTSPTTSRRRGATFEVIGSDDEGESLPLVRAARAAEEARAARRMSLGAAPTFTGRGAYIGDPASAGRSPSIGAPAMSQRSASDGLSNSSRPGSGWYARR